MKICLLGRTLICSYNHYYCKFNYKEMIGVPNERLKAFEVNYENINLIQGNKSLGKMMQKEQDYIKGYGFINESGDVIGRIFVMKRGGNELLYKIRKIDTYIVGLKVFEGYRGHNYAGEILTWLFENLHRNGIQDFYLMVKKDNMSAIHCYQKIGYQIIGSRYFVRLLGRINIPYYTL